MDFGLLCRGGFGIQRSGVFISSCDGIQAHASSCASPKVHEIARKFPQKILAEQASCLVMWPTQPPESEAKEENIALYFFAKDLERFKVLLYGDYNASLHGG
jgi:hypothetical protein